MEYKWKKALKREAKQNSLRERTIDAYMYHNDKFLEFMKTEKNLYDPNIKELDKVMFNITYEDIEKFIRYKQAKVSSSTLHQTRAAIYFY